MRKKVFGVHKLPSGRQLLSSVVVAGHFAFVSGMGPGKEKLDYDVKEQVRDTLDKIETILKEIGTSLENVLKVTVFLTDMSNYGAMNEVYSSYFGKNPPARTCVQIVRSPMSIKQLVEIEVIALIP